MTVTNARSQIVCHSAKNRTLGPCNMITSSLTGVEIALIHLSGLIKNLSG